MTTSTKSISILSMIIVSMFVASTAFATNGYFTHGVGTKNKAMAGAGTAHPQDAIDVANNPAAAALVGKQVVAGIGLFSPIRDYTSSESMANGMGGAFTIGPNAIDSENEIFFIPNISASWQLGERSGVAVALYGRGGMDTEWQGGTASFEPLGPGTGVATLPGTYGGGKAGVNLSQAFLNFTFGRQELDGQLSWGVSAILAGQSFEAFGLENFAGFTETFASSGGMQMPANLSNNGHDNSFGGGAALGILWQPNPKFGIGVRYTSKMYMSKLDDYADLFANGGEFDIPANASIGIAYKPVDHVVLTFDVENIWYSDVDSIGNPVQNIFDCPPLNPGSMDTSGCLGGSNGAGFGWDDMTIFKLGVEYAASEAWTWRGGISYGEQPIGSDQMTFNILAPGIMETHVTAGFTRTQQNDNEWSLTFMYAPENSVSGPNNFDPTQTIELTMHEFELEFAYGWK